MRCPNNRAQVSKGLPLLEMVIALAIVGIVLTAILPIFRSIRNSWDSKAGAAETLQNGRVLIDHLNRNLAKAVRITAVSASSETNGYIEFEDNDGSTLRYDVADNNYVEFGPEGDLSDLAGPVSKLQFTCYDGNDFENSSIDVNSIRFVKVETTLTNLSALGQDKTLIASAYLRANGDSDSSSGNETVRDDFDAQSFSGNNGTRNWSNDWQEVGEADGPTSGYVQVRTNYAQSGYAVDLTTTWLQTRGVWREANLSGATNATLTYDYKSAGLFGLAVVQVYNGLSWSTIKTYDLSSTPSGSESIDISSYIASNSRLRFRVSLGFAVIGFDNVKIEYGSGGEEIRP